MRAMVLTKPEPIERSPLQLLDLPIPEPGRGEVLIQVEVCGVCHTDLHVTEGDLIPHKAEIVPGHEVVGRIARCGQDATHFKEGDRVGAAWLWSTDGTCPYCRRGQENICENPLFTGYDQNGGYAEYMVAREDFIYPIPEGVSSQEAAPFLCAGIIGYRALRRSEVGPGESLGLYGFGASAHVVVQIARHWNCPVYVATRGEKHRELALQLGAEWVGPGDATPPVKLRSAILFAPAGEIVPQALKALDKGGVLACAGIYMTPIPQMDYGECLFQERDLRSVTTNTRQDGHELMKLAADIPLHTHTEEFPLEQANQALQKLKNDQINGAAVLRIAQG